MKIPLSADVKASSIRTKETFACLKERIRARLTLVKSMLEPKQFKNNLIMFEDKPQVEYAA